MTPQSLAKFRSVLTDCELAVFADIGSGTVLGADGALRYPQEYLDALCASAARIFEVSSPDGKTPIEHAVFLTPTGCRAFFRALAEPSEALCCICGPDVELTKLLTQGRAAMGLKGAKA